MIGKTAEAKTDLARLQEVRRRREAAAAQREAEAAGELPVDTRIPSANEQRPPRRPRRRRQRRRARRYKRHTGNLDLEYAPHRCHRATCVSLSSSNIIVYRLQIFFHASVPTSRTGELHITDSCNDVQGVGLDHSRITSRIILRWGAACQYLQPTEPVHSPPSSSNSSPSGVYPSFL